MIYLRPDDVEAYVTLAAVCEREGKNEHAARAYRGALAVLRSRPQANDDEDELAAAITGRMEVLDAGA